MRSGDEPSTARSPLRLRLVLAIFGAAVATAGAAGFALAGLVWPAALFAAVAAVALVNIAVVVVRLRQGPRFQPGPDVPPLDSGRDWQEWRARDEPHAHNGHRPTDRGRRRPG